MRDIVLSFFGGVTRMTDEVERPGDEFALTAVGPWTSIVLGGAFGLVATAADHLGLPAVAEVTGELGRLNALSGTSTSSRARRSTAAASSTRSCGG